jgi:hypothetical protein
VLFFISTLNDSNAHLCWVKVLQLQTGCPLKDYFNLLHLKSKNYKQLKNWKTNQVNPCAHIVANLVSKQDPKIARNSRISWENWDFPSPKLQFSSHKIRFSSTAFWFLQQLSAFFNGFPLSSMAFRFSSTAFHFPRNLGKSIYGGKYTEDRYPSFVFQPKSQYSAIK